MCILLNLKKLITVNNANGIESTKQDITLSNLKPTSKALITIFVEFGGNKSFDVKTKIALNIIKNNVPNKYINVKYLICCGI